MITPDPDTSSRPSESSRGDTGEAIDRMLSDWQNWTATKLNETEMARLAYDVQELIRGEVEVVKQREVELTIINLINKGLFTREQLDTALSSGQTDGSD